MFKSHDISEKFYKAFLIVIFIIVCCFLIFRICVCGKSLYDDYQSDNSQQAHYEEALKLSCEGSDTYLDGILTNDFDIYGIDYDTYTILISDDKERIYLKSKKKCSILPDL